MVKLGYLTIPKDGGVPASLPLCFPSWDPRKLITWVLMSQ
jgi:hypothetical protein